MKTVELPDFREVPLDERPPEFIASQLIADAIDMGASDLYFLSDEDCMTVAVRRLGVVQEVRTMDPELGLHLITSVKALAELDIAERRRPLDGRWIHNQRGELYDIRISVIPTMYGSDLTMRLLSRETKQWTFDQLGLTPGDKGRLLGMLTSPSGLVLVTGPTGTGKTTTLYTCLQYLNDGRHKINTLEDPIEYSIKGVRQSQVNPQIGLDFAQLLRSILRQAPDVIMVGEIRDPETATTAVRAANSGHLVFATLHAPVAAGAIHTMLNMEVQAHLLANCLVGVVAQRLLRVLCKKCRQRYDLPAELSTFDEIREMLEPNDGRALYGAKGCSECFDQGYDGREGVFEVLTVNSSLRAAIAALTPSTELQKLAVDQGMVPFRRGALAKVAQGVTSIEEVVRTVPGELLGDDG